MPRSAVAAIDPSPDVGLPSQQTLRRLAIACVGLLLLAYAGFAAYRYNEIREETEQRLARTLQIAQEHALKVFDTNATMIDRVVDLLGSDPAVTLAARGPTLHQFLSTMARGRPQVQSMWIFGPDGNAIASDRAHPPPAGSNVSDRSFFRFHSTREGELSISEVLGGRSNPGRSFDMSRGRYAPDGTFLGVVSVSLAPAYFEQVHAQLSGERGQTITLFRADGAILSRHPAREGLPDRLPASTLSLQSIAQGIGSGGYEAPSSLDNVTRLVRFARVGEFPVYVSVGLDKASLAAAWVREMTVLAAFGMPSIILLIATAHLALRRTLQLAQSANTLREETAARQRAQEALVQSQKLEAMGRLTGGVAHDFNNSLMVINTSLAILKMKLPQQVHEQLDAISRAVKSGAQSIRQLQAFSRRQAIAPETIDLKARSSSLESLLTPVLGGSVELSIDIAPDTLQVRVDPAELELALLNIAINARDAMDTGGRLAFRARNATNDELPATVDRPAVVLEMTDTGPGIPSAVIDKVFEPFFTTKPVGHGTGLGLSQVYGFCQRAGGAVAVRSEEGQGATVRMFLPAAPVQGGETTKTQMAAELDPLGLEVLLVEDNAQVAAALKEVLQAMDCVVLHRPDAPAAYSWLQQAGGLPEVVITDIVMPGAFDGAVLAEKIAAEFPQLPVILLSGYSEHIQRLSEQGFTVLPKPCSAQALAAALQRATV